VATVTLVNRIPYQSQAWRGDHDQRAAGAEDCCPRGWAPFCSPEVKR
jgi:hypothetical protein